MWDELAHLDATAQAELVRAGQVKPSELVEAAIRRIESLNPILNAVIYTRFEKALAEASSPELPRGPFRGVPFLLKDLVCHTAGDPFFEGMGFLKALGWREAEDTFLAARFRRAGFVFLGKTNTPELGIVPTTEPAAFGPTRNPWDTSRTPGGSSGGSAAAVASRMVPVAHGNDGGGSIRIPASMCGLVGLKPTRGRTSLGPDYPELPGGLVVEHVLARSVRDTAAILDAVAGPMPGDPSPAPPPARPYREEVGAEPGRLRVGVMRSAPGGLGEVHPDCAQALGSAAELLEDLGHHVEEAWPRALEDPEYAGHFITLWAVGVAGNLRYWEERTGRRIGPEDVEPLTWALAEMGRGYSALDVYTSLAWLAGNTRKVAAWWDGFDLLLTPTIAEPPPLLGELAPDPENPLQALMRGASLVPFTPWVNVTGQPAISLPLWWNREGLPIGVQLVAAYGREDLLIRVASQLEEARPWADRTPRILS